MYAIFSFFHVRNYTHIFNWADFTFNFMKKKQTHIRFVYVLLRIISNLSINMYNGIEISSASSRWVQINFNMITRRFMNVPKSCHYFFLLFFFLFISSLCFFPVDFEMQFWNKWWWSQNRFYAEHTHTHTHTDQLLYNSSLQMWLCLMGLSLGRDTSFWVCVCVFFQHIHLLYICVCVCTIKNAKRSKWMFYNFLDWLHSVRMVCTLQ